MRTFACLLLLVGCSVDPCQPGQTENELGFCVPVMEGAGAQAGAPAGDAAGAPEDMSAAGQGGAAPACEMPSDFGDECVESSECHCEVDYCALQPGQTSGICTRTGCLEDESICPEGWMCLDLSAFSPELPSICVPPA